jgi:uncharacterized protein YkwD
MKFALIPFLCLAAALAAGPAPGQEAGAPDPERVAQLVLELANGFRVEQGLRAVEPDESLKSTASYFADYLARTEAFRHDADGADPAARAARRGYDACIISENLGHRYSSRGFAARELAQGFVEGWKASPGHRRNLLEPDVTQTGIAVARGRTGHYYAVQMFGRPASQAVTFQVANRADTAIRYRIGRRAYTLSPRQTRTHTQCRSEDLAFDRAGRQPRRSFKPGDGERYAVVRAGSGGLEVTPLPK